MYTRYYSNTKILKRRKPAVCDGTDDMGPSEMIRHRRTRDARRHLHMDPEVAELVGTESRPAVARVGGVGDTAVRGSEFPP